MLPRLMSTILMTTIGIFIIPTVKTFLQREERFLAVSHSFSSRKLYHRVSNTKPFQNEPSLDLEAKKQICEDITGSYLFQKKEEYPYEKHLGFLRWIERFSYPTTLIPIPTESGRSGEVKDEVVFVCLIRYGMLRNKYRAYYISEEYNLNAEPDGGPTFSRNYLAGRFIFRNFRKGIRVYGLAELPGKAFISPDHEIERFYLRRREKNRVARSWDLDGLCRLEIDDRQRICVAVLNSVYFEGKITFSNGIRPHSMYSCALKRVSFQTDYGKEEATKYDELKEWMLDCMDDQKNNEFRYLLSYAYESDEIFVYSRGTTDNRIFTENITVRVRLAVIGSLNARPPSLVDEEEQNDYKRVKYSV